MPKDNKMPSYYIHVAFLFTLVLPTYAALKVSVGAATVLLVTGSILMIFTRLEDIETLNLYGLGVKLRDQIREAVATLEQLRKLAVGIAQPALTSIAKLDTDKLSNVALISDVGTWRYTAAAKVVGVLRTLELPQSEIDKASSYFDRILHIRVYSFIFDGSGLEGGGTIPHFQTLFSDRQLQNKIPSVSEVRAKVAEQSIFLTDYAERLLIELESYENGFTSESSMIWQHLGDSY